MGKEEKIQVEGTVIFASENAGRLRLDLADKDAWLKAQVNLGTNPAPYLRHIRIRASGNLILAQDLSGHFKPSVLHVPSLQQIELLGPEAEDWRTHPVVSIATLQLASHRPGDRFPTHDLRHRLDEEERRPEVDVHQQFPQLRRCVEDGAAVGQRAGVDEDVDPAKVFICGGDEGFYLVEVTQLGGDEDWFRTEPGQGGGHLLPPLDVAPGHHDAGGTLLGEP